MYPGLTGNYDQSALNRILSNPASVNYNPTGVQQGLSAGSITPSNQVLGSSTTMYGPAYNGPVAPSGGGGGTGTPSAPSAPSSPAAPDELQTQLDSIFNPVFSALQGQENTLSQNYASVPGEIQGQYDVSKQSLGNEQASGMRALTEQETAMGARKEDALTSATRLYNELQRGGQQRFGGASSAGEAYQTLTATEQQRRQGSIYGAYETAMQQVGQYKANLQDKYATAVKEVDLRVQQAKADAQAQFRDALQQIRNAKAQAQSDKATASMNALQELRNRIYTVNLQALQFTQQLALNHEATLAQVKQYEDRARQDITGAQQTASAFGTQAQTLASNTKYGIGAPQASPTLAQTGQVTPTRKYDELGNPIA